MATVHREGRKAEAPLGGSQNALDPRVARRACEEPGLDWSLLPGLQGRVRGQGGDLSSPIAAKGDMR